MSNMAEMLDKHNINVHVILVSEVIPYQTKESITESQASS